MTKEKELVQPHLELGDYLELLQETIPVNGKLLTNGQIYQMTAMSPKTYAKVKGAEA